MTVYDALHTNLAKAKADALRAESTYTLGSTSIPGEVAKQKARLRDLTGMSVYKGADSLVLSSLNAHDHDHVTHLGWSYQPTPEWLAIQSPN